MSSIKITPTLINDVNYVDPIKYFVSKHSVYPFIVNFPTVNVNLNLLFESLKNKFNEFTYFYSCEYNKNLDYKYFCFMHDEKDSCIIFKFQDRVLSFYSKYEDEGLINILSTMIKDCYETQNNN